jgi:hypothetical protein
MVDDVQTQLPDGRWVRAQPIPYPVMKCVTPLWRRLYLRVKHWRDEDAMEAALEWVAVEPSAQERGLTPAKEGERGE